MNNKEVSVERRVGAGVGVYLFFFKECCFRVWVRLRVSVNPNPNPKTAFSKKKKNRPGRRLRPRDLLTPIKSWQNLKEVMKGVH